MSADAGRIRTDTAYPAPAARRLRGAAGESWGALVSEGEQRSAYGSQTVGPFGYLQYGRQQVREWRLEREQMAKARRDEARSIDEAADGAVPE